MKRYPYRDAKEAITTICQAAAAGKFDTRDTFITTLSTNPHIAVQGYNPHGKIFFWNDASTHLYGHSEAAAVNQDLVGLILPAELQSLLHDMIAMGTKTGKMPEASACDLVRYNGDRVTVFSGHLVFKWNTSYPEFYCINLPIEQ